jgi:hypothetical protein
MIWNAAMTNQALKTTYHGKVLFACLLRSWLPQQAVVLLVLGPRVLVVLSVSRLP